MLADTELDNRVLKSQLSKKFPNKVNMGFGVDDNKIKGIDTFPIYDKTTHFRSNARDNVDEFMFTSRQKKYDVSGMKHNRIFSTGINTDRMHLEPIPTLVAGNCLPFMVSPRIER